MWKLKIILKLWVRSESHNRFVFSFKFYSLKFYETERNDVVISEEFKLKHSQLDEKWRWYLSSLKQAEVLLDNCKDSFKENLLQDAGNLEVQATALLDSFDTIPTSFDT